MVAARVLVLRQVRLSGPHPGRTTLAGPADPEAAPGTILRGDLDRFLAQPRGAVGLRLAHDAAAEEAHARVENRLLLALLQGQQAAIRGSRVGSGGPDTC